MTFICSDCLGDVERLFVGTTVKYVHAVKGIDHGPTPYEVPVPQSGQQTVPPTASTSARIAGSAVPPTAPEPTFPEDPAL